MDKYPSIEDNEFQFKIAKKLEFRNLDNVDGLYPHQEFVRRFMSPYTPYDSLIMYHSLGSGKSIACIAVAVDHYIHDKKKCIIVTKGDSGTENFAKQIQMYHKMSSRSEDWNMSSFSFKHYISMSNQICNLHDEDVTKAFSNSIIVLDEVHNVKYLRKDNENSVYGSIIRLLRLCSNVKIIIATATPMTDSPEQIQSLLGICNYSRNDKWSMNGIISYNSTILHKPESSEIGTEKFISGILVYPSYMISHQEIAYRKENSVQPPDDIYRKLTHISLFCFKDGIYGREITKTKMNKIKTNVLITSMSSKQTKEIKYYKYKILPQYAHMLTGKNLRQSSCKYSKVIEDLTMNTRGNTFIFLEEVKGSGLLLLASVLEQHGYELYIGQDLNNIPKKKRYTMCVGSLDICPNNTDRLDGFNSDINKDGEYVEVLLGSRVIGESITLKNVRQFYCLTPHWNDSTVDQAIGRVVRNCSHSLLNKNERNVNIYIHAAIFTDDPQSSVDIKKLAKCKEKERHIQAVAETMISFAVDRYKDDPELPVTQVHNFAAAYLHNHMDKLVYIINNFFNKYHTTLTTPTTSNTPDVVSCRMCVGVCECCGSQSRIIKHQNSHPNNTAGAQHSLLMPIQKSVLDHQKYESVSSGLASRVVSRSGNICCVSIVLLSEALDIHHVICKEAICRIISSNIAMTYENKTGYYFLRAYGDNVFTVEDISVPFVSMPDISVSDVPSYSNTTHTHNSHTSDVCVCRMCVGVPPDANRAVKHPTANAHLHTKYVSVSVGCMLESGVYELDVFRYMPVKHKAAFIEECILNNKQENLKAWHLDGLYANISINSTESRIFHLLLYRDLDSSYTSSNIVPKKPMGKTRMLDSDRWVTVTDTTVEQRVLNEYRILAQGMIDYYDEHFDIYGIISTIDGDMRLRLRDAEDVRKSSKDNRYVRRGKNMRSIKKEDLSQILNYLYSNADTSQEYNFSINEMAKRINDVLVKKELYIVV